MTLWQRILQGITALVTSTGISMVSGVVSAFLTFRYLTPAEYGRLALFISYYSLGTIFLNLGLDAIVTSEIARARGEQQWGLIRQILRRYTFLVIGAAVLLFTLFFVIGQFAEQTFLWRVMAVYLLLTAPNRIMSILFHSTTRYRRLASLIIVRSVSRMVLLLLLPFWWSYENILGIALIFPLLELIVLATAVWLFRHAWQEIAQVDPQPKKVAWRDFLPLIQAQSVYVIMSLPVKTVAEQLPIWFLRGLLGETAVGIYSAAQRTYLFILAAFRTIETTLFPLVSEQMKQNPERLRVVLRQAQKYTFWLGLITIIFTLLLANPIINFVAGDDYSQAALILQIIVWHLLFFALSQAQRPVFFANRAQKWLFVTYFLGLVIGLIIYPITIWQFGVMGAGIGFIVYNSAVILARQQVTRLHIADFYISPRTIFQIEPFDYLLVQNIAQKVFGRRSTKR